MIARAGTKKEHVERLDSTHFRVAVKTLPIKGRANLAIREALAKFLGVARTRLTLKTGGNGKHKVFILNNANEI